MKGGFISCPLYFAFFPITLRKDTYHHSLISIRQKISYVRPSGRMMQLIQIDFLNTCGNGQFKNRKIRFPDYFQIRIFYRNTCQLVCTNNRYLSSQVAF